VAIQHADAIDDALASILLDPLRWETIASDIRAFTVHGFPYRVVFRAEDGVVWVLSVAHYSSRPGYWHARFDG
jgi:L-amino acid N-acyltransferase YncA